MNWMTGVYRSWFNVTPSDLSRRLCQLCAPDAGETLQEVRALLASLPMDQRSEIINSKTVSEIFYNPIKALLLFTLLDTAPFAFCDGKAEQRSSITANRIWSSN